ncbi:MAG: hypothetical protein LBR37_03850 [Erysipelotrichaceae bacterium]|jgi:hypothetical protein|nr:hypothetical protein [Erysipelotrichaceae bacterium]
MAKNNTELNDSFTLIKNYQKLVDLSSSIDASMGEIEKQFLRIGSRLSKIRDEKLYLTANYETIEDFAKERFNLSLTTIKNLIRVYITFSNQDDSMYSLELKKEYKDYSFSQLTELLSIPEDDRKNLPATFTIRKIREIKKSGRTSDSYLALEEEIKQAWFKAFPFIPEKSHVKDIKFSKVNNSNSFYFIYEILFSFLEKKDLKIQLNLNLETSVYSLGGFYIKDNFKHFFIENSKKLDKFFLNLKDKLTELFAPKKFEKGNDVKAVTKKRNPNQTLKNDKQREEFIKNPDNWLLVDEAKTLGFKFYRLINDKLHELFSWFIFTAADKDGKEAFQNYRKLDYKYSGSYIFERIELGSMINQLKEKEI